MRARRDRAADGLVDEPGEGAQREAGRRVGRDVRRERAQQVGDDGGGVDPDRRVGGIGGVDVDGERPHRRQRDVDRAARRALVCGGVGGGGRLGAQQHAARRRRRRRRRADAAAVAGGSCGSCAVVVLERRLLRARLSRRLRRRRLWARRAEEGRVPRVAGAVGRHGVMQQHRALDVGDVAWPCFGGSA